MTTRSSERDLIADLVALVRAHMPELSETQLKLILTQPDLASARSVAVALGWTPGPGGPDLSFAGEAGPVQPTTRRVPRGRGREPEVPVETTPVQPIPAVDPVTGEQILVDGFTGQTLDPTNPAFAQYLTNVPAIPGTEDEEGFAGGFSEDFRPLVSAYGVRPLDLVMGRPLDDRMAPGQAPRYYEQDAWRLFGGRSPEYIGQVKQAMIASGLIDEDEAGPMGHWRVEDERTMYSVMAEANASGTTWNRVLERYAESNDPKSRAQAWREANPFIGPVFRSPDYATLAQAARRWMGGELGRDPKEYELALLADEMRADFNRKHAADVTAARSQYEATARGVETGRAQSGGTVAEVDPLARFSERMLERYGPERERREDVEEQGVNVGGLVGSLLGLERAVETAG